MIPSSSVISSLSGLLDRYAIGAIASRIGESEQSVSRGLPPAFAAVISGICNRSGEPEALHHVFEVIADVPAYSLTDATLANIALGGEAAAPLFAGGDQLVSLIFGANRSEATAKIAQAAQVTTASAARMLGIAAPMALGTLAKSVRENEIPMERFAAFIRNECEQATRHVPAMIQSAATTPENSRKLTDWLVPLCVLSSVLLGVIWYLHGGAGKNYSQTDVQLSGFTSEAKRSGTSQQEPGNFVRRELPGNPSLDIPENGMENRFLTYIQNSVNPDEDKKWFVFDRLVFDPGSAIPRPESDEQLRSIAAILQSYPSVRLEVGGFTDKTGDSKASARLSENRALGVKRELVAIGVDASRLEARGYGDRHPIADNTTAEGRAKNRRISVRVLDK